MSAAECDDRLIAVLHDHLNHFLDDEAFDALAVAVQAVQDETAEEYADLVREERDEAREKLAATTARLTAAEHAVSRYVDAFARVSALALKVDAVVGKSWVARLLTRWHSFPEERHVRALSLVMARLEGVEPPKVDFSAVTGVDPGIPSSLKARRRAMVDVAASAVAEVERLL